MTRARRRLVRAASTTLATTAVAAAAPAPAAGALPACRSAPCADDRPPVVVLSYYMSRHFPRLVRAARRSGLPPDTPVYYGNYWGSGRPSEPNPPRPRGPRPRMPNGRHAPIFPIARSVFWHKRRLPLSQRRKLGRGLRRWAGKMPSLRAVLRRSAAYRLAWGLELGRRFRDRIRSKRARGSRVTTWQFDEIVSETAGSGGGRYRTFLRGILHGISNGRPELGDRHLPGLVFVTPQALRLANRPARGDLALFWRTLDRASLYVIGEEYPAFAGSARRAARRMAKGQGRLRRWGGARRSLARKYVVGMTPGYRLGQGLGGNVRHLSHGAVNAWRSAYIRSRARDGVAGFGQFALRYRNGRPAVMNDVLRALADGVRARRRGG